MTPPAATCRAQSAGTEPTNHRRSRHANTCGLRIDVRKYPARAEAIARGLESAGTVTAVPVAGVGDEDLSGYDLVMVGGPTHVHGMSRESTRHGAAVTARKPDSTVALEPDAESEGLREWLDGLPPSHGKAVAFDTRADGPALLTGRASKGICRKLRLRGFDLVAESESFLVDKESRLEEGEETRAEQWGRTLAQQVTSSRA